MCIFEQIIGTVVYVNILNNNPVSFPNVLWKPQVSRMIALLS